MDVEGTWYLHRITAYSFYLFVFLTLTFMTLHVLRKMRNSDSSFMSKFNYFMLAALAIYFWINCLLGYYASYYLPTKPKVPASMNEWLALYVLIFWFIAFT